MPFYSDFAANIRPPSRIYSVAAMAVIVADQR
jgi:hypothetical protein